MTSAHVLKSLAKMITHFKERNPGAAVSGEVTHVFQVSETKAKQASIGKAIITLRSCLLSGYDECVSLSPKRHAKQHAIL